jgi:glycosyltransferase involved in cell wall biosynthesis
MLAFNRPAVSQPQLLVDISELVTRDSKTGVQRVTRSILMELLKNPPQGYTVRLVYATHSEQGYRYANHYLAKLGDFPGAGGDDSIIDVKPSDIFLGLDLQHHIVVAQEQYLHLLHRHGVKIYFVVYDLLPILMPHFFRPLSDANHRKWLSVLVNFDGALCISKSVAAELGLWLQTNPRSQPRPFKIGWFHLGADIENSSPSLGMSKNASEVLGSLARKTSFLMVGTVEPRKGHSLVLEAFERLWTDGEEVNLVIVGQAGWMVDALIDKLRAHPERENRMFWLEGISDEYLEKVYASSTCLIAASEGEGFGLPLIEAAQHKLPIIARDIPVFREVAGDHAWYFDGNDAERLAQAVRLWLLNYGQGTHPRSDDMPSISWAESARQLISNIIPSRSDAPQPNR